MHTVARRTGSGGCVGRANSSLRHPSNGGSGAGQDPPAAVYVMQHEGATRIVHQPDGTIVCEPASPGAMMGPAPVDLPTLPGPDEATGAPCGFKAVTKEGLLNQGRRLLTHVMISGGVLGYLVSFSHMLHARASGERINHGAMVREVSTFVRGCMLGAVTGAMIAPVSVALGVARIVLRPVVLGLGVHAAARWLRRHQLGAAALLKKLQSGDLVRQVEALRRIVARLAASAAFAAQFKRLAGVEALLKVLEEVLEAVEEGAGGPGPAAPLAATALAQLALQGDDVVDVVLDRGGVSLLVRALSQGLASNHAGRGSGGAHGEEADAGSSGPAALMVYSAAALARITAKNAVAQQLIASEPGAARVVVGVLQAATARSVQGATPAACDELRGYAVALCQALALEPAAKAQLGEAGGVEALSAALVIAGPWTVGQAATAAALHTLVRGDAENQRRLAAAAPGGLSAAIHRALVTATPAAAAAAPTSIGSIAAFTAASGCTRKPGPVDAIIASWGGLSKPLPPDDHPSHRAELLALNNVIARFAPPPPMADVPAPAAIAAPAPRTHFLQRIGLRAPRAAPAAVIAPVAPTAVRVRPVSRPSSPDRATPTTTAAVPGSAPQTVVSMEAVSLEVGEGEMIEVSSADLEWEHDLGTASSSPEKAPQSPPSDNASTSPASITAAPAPANTKLPALAARVQVA